MNLAIIIVNYKTAPLVIDCLRSLQDQLQLGWHVYLTDNASPDDSVAILRGAIAENHWESWCTLMPLQKNGGFAYGNNAALQTALALEQSPPFYLLLNPDTVVRPGAIAALLDYAAAYPQAGIFGSRLEDSDGTPQRSAFRFPGVLSELEGSVRLGAVSRLLHRYVVAPPVSALAGACDWVAGASFLVRSGVFAAIGLMDEDYFMYYEEVDFCLRARQAGWACHYVPASRVVHLVGQSSGVTDKRQANRRRPAYWFESRRRYLLKHLGRGKTLLADSLAMIGFTLWRLRRWLQRKPDTDPQYFLRDFWRHSVLNPLNSTIAPTGLSPRPLYRESSEIAHPALSPRPLPRERDRVKAEL